jgi:activating signal cointegrator complex subunit 2
MKAEILRRAEAMSDDSDEEERGRPKALDVIDLDDDFDEAGTSTVKTLGDGEESGDEEVDPVKPETILERAYIRDPKLFGRDGETRRSKTRADLKQQTGNDYPQDTLGATEISLPGLTDEQIEGWRIMLERNVSGFVRIHSHSHVCTSLQPKKERILQKHEFSGNRTMNILIAEGTGDQPGAGQRGGGRGRGRGRGQGRGGGGGGGSSGPGEKNDEVARERALKEKHKSSNRKRGHDKKMGKTGVGPST